MSNQRYSAQYRKFYTDLSRLTGMSNDELDMLFIRIIKVITNDLNRSGEVLIPYLGKFKLKRMPPRKRVFLENPSDPSSNRISVSIPASDKLKFTVNRHFSKLFR